MFLKITSGFLKGRKIKVPSTSIRPTGEKVRCAYFNTLFSMIEFENRSFMDFFSGSGAFAFEALSRGFLTSTVIEKDPVCIRQIKNSSEELGVKEKITIFSEDAFSVDFECFKEKKFNAIYIDPPYVLGDRMDELLEKIINHNITNEVCVICVEGKSFADWNKIGWSSKKKNFGDTFLTFFYNWGADDE